MSHGEPFTEEEPTLRDFFERIRPVATQALAPPSPRLWPTVTLNLDFKDSHPEHFAAIWDLLGEFDSWLTTAPRFYTLNGHPVSQGARPGWSPGYNFARSTPHVFDGARPSPPARISSPPINTKRSRRADAARR